MTDAQRLADQLNAFEASGLWYPSREAAAELRRLDAIESKWAGLSQDDGKAQREVERLRALNAQLLEFASEYLSNWGDLDGYLQDMGRAAIAAQKGKP